MRNKDITKRSIKIGTALGFIGYLLLIPLAVFESQELLDYVFFSVTTFLLILTYLKGQIIKIKIGHKRHRFLPKLLVDGFLIMFTVGYILFRNSLVLYGRSGYYSPIFGFIDLQRLGLLIIAYAAFLGLKIRYDAKNINRKRQPESYLFDIIVWSFYLTLLL